MDPIEQCPVHPTYHSHSQMGLPERVAPQSFPCFVIIVPTKNAHKLGGHTPKFIHDQKRIVQEPPTGIEQMNKLSLYGEYGGFLK